MSTQPRVSVTFTGPLAAVFNGLVAEKQGTGYRYDSRKRELLQLDRFCIAVGHHETSLPQELVLNWITKQPHEAESTRQRRVSLIRIVGEYMQRCGYLAYVSPRYADRRPTHRFIPYIFSRSELVRLFTAVDACEPHPASPQRHRLLPSLFRLLYGCGLRLSEALTLRVKDVDLAAGTVHIRDTKFRKERLVPLHPALVEWFRQYLPTSLALIAPDRFVFASPQGAAYARQTVYQYFRQFLWAAGISHGGRGRGPRLHDLRHTFAVHCLQRWVTSGADLSAALPYLSAYLGHTGLHGTQLYLRLTAELYPHIIAAVERKFGPMLPGGMPQ